MLRRISTGEGTFCRNISRICKKKAHRGGSNTLSSTYKHEALAKWAIVPKYETRIRNLYMNLMKKPDHKQSFRLSKVEALPARQCYRLNSTGNSWHMHIFGESCLLVKLLWTSQKSSQNWAIFTNKESTGNAKRVKKCPIY